METSIEMIEAIEAEIDFSRYLTILEPSAGEGKISSYFVSNSVQVDVVELNKQNAEALAKSMLYKVVHHGDFLRICKSNLIYKAYDYVVAVPPYKDNVDCQHIMAMYDCCKKGGKVISFTLPYWMTGFYDNQRLFRQWLSTKNYKMKLFEDDKSYLSCPKMLLTIQK